MVRTIPILERRFFPQGHMIMTEGDDAQNAYIIQSGSALVTKKKNGQEVELARLGVGDIFGETALMFDEPRMASIKALEDCNLIVITRKVLEEKLADSDPTIRAIVKMMKERLKAANTDRVNKTPTEVADIHKLFNDAFKIVLKHLDPSERKNYQNEASPVLREFLDLTQIYIERHSRKG